MNYKEHQKMQVVMCQGAETGVELAQQLREQCGSGILGALIAIAAAVILLKEEGLDLKALADMSSRYWKQLRVVKKEDVDMYLKERDAAGEKVVVVGEGFAPSDAQFVTPKGKQN